MGNVWFGFTKKVFNRKEKTKQSGVPTQNVGTPADHDRLEATPILQDLNRLSPRPRPSSTGWGKETRSHSKVDNDESSEVANDSPVVDVSKIGPCVQVDAFTDELN